MSRGPYICEPYKGFVGRAEWDEAAGIFHGNVIGIHDVVTFQGKSISELYAAFQSSVDDYLKFKKQTEDSPK